MMKRLSLFNNRFNLAQIILCLVFACSSTQANAQKVPQVTGWTFSRSFGRGIQKTTSTTSNSAAELLNNAVNTNVSPPSSANPNSIFRIVDPEQPFAVEAGFRTLDSEEKVQNINFFNLQDWGYSVFTF